VFRFEHYAVRLRRDRLKCGKQARTSPAMVRKGYRTLDRMIRQIAPVFFTTDIPGTLAYCKDMLGFECLGTWQDPPVYAIVARDQRAIHFRCAEPPTPNPDKYADELLDAYIFVEDADALYAEYSARGMGSPGNFPTCHGTRESLS
jgi:hypothetical protein